MKEVAHQKTPNFFLLNILLITKLAHLQNGHLPIDVPKY